MSETLLNLDLADVGTIRMVCTACRASAELPVAPLEGDLPERCFHCRAEWFLPGSPPAVALQHLFRSLVQLRNRDYLVGIQVQLGVRPDRGALMIRAPQ
ncbi:hypothetical protein [Nitrospira moscoviensis]|uniref:Uncharacterized protein n=1 Tax=Nitrospira moscoviensis TaxID=42253 RepID=A0A0K2GCI2_NITMO|nr:hypothetical protein [Nitrospira moscoviensis]ALA58665.1 hypothetical protein NITMOv2_2249 [Nitrospira moscoviensis]